MYRKRYNIENFRFSIKNFKCLKNEKLMNLKPITIFCGINSSGKSSIIQSQLLISQSLFGQYINPKDEKVMIPQIFIFEGDKCHLQDYRNIIFENNIQNKMEFEWIIETKKRKSKIKIICGYMPEDTKFSRGFPIVEKIILKTNKDSVSKILELNLMKKKIPFYELNIDNFNFDFKKFFSKQSLFSHDFAIEDEKISKKEFREILYYLQKDDQEKYSQKDQNNLQEFYSKLLKHINFKECNLNFRSIFPSSIKIKKDPISDFINTEEFKDLFYRYNIDNKFYRKILTDFPKFSKFFSGLFHDFIEREINEILYEIFRPLAFYYRKLRYLGPLREEPRRFYTFSDLRLLKLGLKGENTTQVLIIQKDLKVNFIKIISQNNHFIFTERKKLSLLDALNEWLEIMKLQEIKPSIAIELITRILIQYSENQPESSTVSLPDVGFGLSQVLPVLVEVLRMEHDDLLILEQPEIHLHPRLQGDLADFILCNAHLNKKFMIETHSEYFLKRLCLRIAQSKDIDLSNLINIYFIVPDVNGRGSKIVDVNIDEFGRILNWPKGFFDDNDDGLILEASMKKQQYKQSSKEN